MTIASSLSVKQSVATVIRTEIISGILAPGERLVEGRLAKRLGVAQTSVREALLELAVEGFVERGPSRSTQVVRLSPESIEQIYQFRTVLEGFAARLLAEKQPDLSDVEQILADMETAGLRGNVRAFYERDQRFHLRFCELSGNSYLAQTLQRLLSPLFAFVLIRIQERFSVPGTVENAIAQHQEILSAVRSGDPDLAEQKTREVIGQFRDFTTMMISRQADVDANEAGAAGGDSATP